ncbi:MAG: hypothetical protein P8Y91_03500, partial [Desulfuromonadales bacterium]
MLWSDDAAGFLERFERFARGVNGLVEIVLTVGDAHEAGFVLRRRQVNPGFQHTAEKASKNLRRFRLDIVDASDLLGLDLGTEHAA